MASSEVPASAEALAPGPAPVTRARARRGPVDARLWRRTRATRGYLIGMAAVGTAVAALVVAQADLLSHAIGAVVDTRTVTPAVAAIPLLAGVVGGRALLAWAGPVLGARAAAQVKSQLRRDVVAGRLAQTETAVDEATTTLTVTSGLDGLDGYFARYLPRLVLAGTVPLLVGLAIASRDLLAAVTVALTLPLIPVFMVLVGWLTADVLQRRARVASRLAHHFADLVAGLPTLQVFGRARAQAEGLRRTGAAHRRETVAALRVSFLSSLVLELLATLSVAVVAVGVGLRLVEGHLDLTTALFVLLLAPEAYLPLRQVGSAYHDATDGLAAVEAAFALIGEEPQPSAAPAPATLPDLRETTIEFDGVTVCDGDRVRLPPLNLTLRPGETVALTGPSGCGKSTAVAALLGFVTPSGGEIRVEAEPLSVGSSATARDAWLRRLAWVPQQPALLAGSVADNVALGAPTAPTSRIRAALDRAGAADLELDQIVIPGSEGLSSGQVRRVALARALLRVDCGGGELLVMDEPTAGLDVESELAAIAGVASLGVGALIVSHRRAVLAAADRVVRLG